MKKILVVDDEIDITFTLRKMLEEAGHHVDVFNDPAAALRAFKAHAYDLVLLDIRMPKINGFELYAQLRMKDEETKVYFMTAFEVHREQFGQLPSTYKHYFIKKPIEARELKEIIDIA